MKKKPIIKKGDWVKDKIGLIGTVTRVEDVHNIHVKYKNSLGGSGIYCIDPNCDWYDPLERLPEKPYPLRRWKDKECYCHKGYQCPMCRDKERKAYLRRKRYLNCFNHRVIKRNEQSA